MASSFKGNRVRGVTSSACVVRFQVPSKDIYAVDSSTAYGTSSLLKMKLRVDPAPEVPSLCSGNWICQIKLWVWDHTLPKTAGAAGFEGSTEIVPPGGLIATRSDVVHFSVMGQHFTAKGSAGRDGLTPWISRGGTINRGLVAAHNMDPNLDGLTAWTYVIAPGETIDVELAFPIATAGTIGIKEASFPVQLWDGQPANRNTDCVLVSRDGKRFPCYRSILAARSTVFAAMFQHDLQENDSGDIKIDDTDDNVLECILEFLYTNRADADRVKDVAEEVYKAAEKYAVAELCTACENIMVDNLSVKTALSYLNFAVPRGLRTLKTRAIQFMSENKEGI